MKYSSPKSSKIFFIDPKRRDQEKRCKKDRREDEETSLDALVDEAPGGVEVLEQPIRPSIIIIIITI